MKMFASILPLLAFLPLYAFATTKGLSQIVTPDLQKPADFSLSFQAQDSSIGNPYQLQAELGITPWLEGAVFRGFDPGEWIFGTEIGLIQHEPYLLSTGFINLSTIDGKPQPFLETGYYTEHHKWIAGAVVVKAKAQLLLGWAYDYDLHWRAQIDYQSGNENFMTCGFTYTLNDQFQFNPALYIGNAKEHSLEGYIVLTYTFVAWATKTINRHAPPAL